MLEQLNQIDTQIFLLINVAWSNPFFDWLMPILREKWIWVPLYVLLLVFFVKVYRPKTTLLIVLFAVIMVVISENVLAETSKQTFKRLRPCQDKALEDKMVERVGCGGMYGFFSAHAANHFALAVFFIPLLKKRFRWVTFALLFWAAIICFAQVYVGKHYPFDVLTGAVIGSLLGFLTYRLLQKSVKQIRA